MTLYTMWLLQIVTGLVGLHGICKATNDRQTFLVGIWSFWTMVLLFIVLVIIGFCGGADRVSGFLAGPN